MTALAAFALSASSFAADNNAESTTALTAQVNQLSAETKALQKEVAVLKNKKHTHRASKKVSSQNVPTQEPEYTHVAGAPFTPWPHFVTVTTTPFLYKKTAYDGSDLLYNLSSMNEDLTLLNQKKVIMDEMTAEGYTLDRPILQLSGSVQGQAFSNGGFGTKATDGISLSAAELDMNAIASSWATAFMSMSFNGAPVSTGNRAPNSTIYLSRGFATIGNLNVAPVYFTGGLMYVPYGRYANGMVNTPVTMSMGRILSPTALLGFSLDNGLYGSIYGFSGSQTSGGNDLFKQGGANLAFKKLFGNDNNYSFGAGWVSNVADAQGQQNNGIATTGGQFGGFAVSQPASNASNNNLVHSVNGFDGHGQVTVGNVSVMGEYLGAIDPYSPADLQYNGAGALPRSMHAEMDYLLPFFAKKYGTTLGVSFGHTWEALALNLPQDKYSVFVNTSIWRETTESIEYDYAQDYAASAIATGRGATAPILGTGKNSNTVTAQVGVYF
ncbi:MAG: hypothetical protein A3F13_01045 [Gammaproteobacteria bacterium RIFCSPHIGHO2_12_FULL_40_19]|nr:MAG: hypothetical protein A3F13_01045 [Gammaproteobacteria bacterium RIFCSPHIGHO2_12_FULL_40_19]